MLLNEFEYTEVWNKVYDELNFKPSVDKGVIAFKIDKPHVVYDISQMTEENKDSLDILTSVFINITKKDEQMYALDWHHSCFKFNPRNPEEQNSFYVEDMCHSGDGYNADFPEYYPNGDYYFFIATDFEFGYLGHPWQQKIWIFGETLIEEIEKISESLGWSKVI